jgi:hypothetical protein
MRLALEDATSFSPKRRQRCAFTELSGGQWPSSCYSGAEDPPGFDRAAFQERINRDIVNFFAR